MQHIAEHSPHDASIILVGNKSDLSSKREVQMETAKTMAEDKRMKYFECSTKENHNIKESFEFLLDSIINNFDISLLDSEKIRMSNRKANVCKCIK